MVTSGRGALVVLVRCDASRCLLRHPTHALAMRVVYPISTDSTHTRASPYVKQSRGWREPLSSIIPDVHSCHRVIQAPDVVSVRRKNSDALSIVNSCSLAYARLSSFRLYQPGSCG